MKRALTATAVTLAMMFLAVGCTAGEKKVEIKELKDQKEKVSYSIGLNIGNDFKTQGVEVDTNILLKGMTDALSGAQPMLTEEQIQETLTQLQKDMVAKQETMAKEAAEKNKTAGAAYLAENGKKEGVTTLPSGLQYKVIEEGTGATPTLESTVTVHYKGTLVDGKEFDSSYARNEPATFPVKGVIPGWTEAMQLMKEGAKWQIVIPSELAYGERGAGPVIGPNSTLVFEVELIKVQ